MLFRLRGWTLKHVLGQTEVGAVDYISYKVVRNCLSVKSGRSNGPAIDYREKKHIIKTGIGTEPY